MAPAPGKVTLLLAEIRAGNNTAEAELIRLVQKDLRRLAARHMLSERPGHTLQPTALVNEVYLRLVPEDLAACQDRVHFFRLASSLMRRILVDHARMRGRIKRKHQKLPLELVGDDGGERPRELIKLENFLELEDLITLNDALQALGRHDARLEQVVDMRFFGGLKEAEIAEALGVSERTIKRDWEFARAWLHQEMYGEAEKKV